MTKPLGAFLFEVCQDTVTDEDRSQRISKLAGRIIRISGGDETAFKARFLCTACIIAVTEIRPFDAPTQGPDKIEFLHFDLSVKTILWKKVVVLRYSTSGLNFLLVVENPSSEEDALEVQVEFFQPDL